MFGRVQSESKGFTLIELMIVVAVVAILVVVALPAYKGYVVRARVIECIHGAALPKIAISEYRQTMAEWPPDEATASISGTSGQSQYCNGFTKYKNKDGSFEIDVNEIAVGASSGKKIQPKLFPDQNNPGVAWYCFSGGTKTDELKYLPSTCRCKSLKCEAKSGKKSAKKSAKK